MKKLIFAIMVLCGLFAGTLMADYYGSRNIGETIVFVEPTYDSAGEPTAADTGLPTYRIYENDTNTPVATGTMRLLDSGIVVGLYSKAIALTSAAGYETGKSYNALIYWETGEATLYHTTMHNFQILAPVNAEAGATVRHVGAGYTYTTISTAVAAASSGDTIIVHPGTYTENVNLNSKAIHLKGTSRAGVIITNTSGAIVTLATGSTLENLSVTTTAVSGSDDIAVFGTGITNFHLKDCDIKGGFDGVYFSNSSSKFTIDNCYIFGKFDGGNFAAATNYHIRNTIFAADGTYATNVACRALHGGGNGTFTDCIFIASRSDTSAGSVIGFEATSAGYIAMNNCSAVASAGTGHTGVYAGFYINEASAQLFINGGIAQAVTTNGTGADIYQNAGTLQVANLGYTTSLGTITEVTNSNITELLRDTETLMASTGYAYTDFNSVDDGATPSDAAWTNIAYAIDGDISTYARSAIQDSNIAEVVLDLVDGQVIKTDGIRLYANFNEGVTAGLYVTVNISADGTNYVESTASTEIPAVNEYIEYSFSELKYLTSIKVRFTNVSGGVHNLDLYDVQFNGVDSVRGVVWNALPASYAVANSFGKFAADVNSNSDAILTDTAAFDTAGEYAAAIWNALPSSYAVANSFGKFIADANSNSDAILTDTAAFDTAGEHAAAIWGALEAGYAEAGTFGLRLGGLYDGNEITNIDLITRAIDANVPKLKRAASKDN